jgi:hypothetical protein
MGYFFLSPLCLVSAACALSMNTPFPFDTEKVINQTHLLDRKFVSFSSMSISLLMLMPWPCDALLSAFALCLYWSLIISRHQSGMSVEITYQHMFD